MPAGKGESVPVRSLADILQQEPVFENVDLIKCDVEGAESEIFSSCAPWIRKIRFLVVETHPPYNAERLQGDLAGNGARFELQHLRKNGPNALSFLRNLNAAA